MGDNRNWLAYTAYALLLVAVATFVWHKGGPWPGGSDSSGYFNHARLLLEGKAREPLRIPEGFDTKAVDAWVFSPLGMRPVGEPPMLAPTYPVGLPLHLATGLLIFGDEAGPRIVLTAVALFAIAATLWVLRLCGVGPLWTLLSGALLAVNPIFLFQALQPMSDVLALAWCAIAFCFALKSRGHVYWALACGVSIGLAVLVRPSNFLIVLPVLILLGMDWRRLGILVLGGMPIALFLGFYQWVLYGSPFASGYGGYGEVLGSVLSNSHVVPKLKHFGLWLGRSFGWVVPVLAIPGLLLGKTPVRVRIALAAWLLAFVAFYAAYQTSNETWWYLRFLLPAYPPLLAGAALFGERLVRWTSAKTIPARFGKIAEAVLTLLLFAASISVSVHWTRKLHAASIADGERVYPDTADWMKVHLPPDAVVLCMQVSGALLYLSNYPLLRYDSLNEAQWAYVQHWRQTRNVALYAVLFPFEYSERKVLESLVPGDWSQVGSVKHVQIFRLND